MGWFAFMPWSDNNITRSSQHSKSTLNSNLSNSQLLCMMTSLNGNIFRVTGPLLRESTGHRWIPLKGQWRRALMFSLICPWTNGWANNRNAGVLRSRRLHYDVTVMTHSEILHTSWKNNSRLLCKNSKCSFHDNRCHGRRILCEIWVRENETVCHIVTQPSESILLVI